MSRRGGADTLAERVHDGAPMQPTKNRTKKRAQRFGAAAALSLAATAATLTLAGEAEAGEPRVEVGASGAGSTWRGDAAAWGSVELGWRFARFIGPYGSFSEGYGAVDTRMLTLLAIGVKVWMPRLGPVRPHARLGF